MLITLKFYLNGKIARTKNIDCIEKILLLKKCLLENYLHCKIDYIKKKSYKIASSKMKVDV
jgi:hypothetical protein